MATETIEKGVCVGCGGIAIKTNNTLCSYCWIQAECFEE